MRHDAGTGRPSQLSALSPKLGRFGSSTTVLSRAGNPSMGAAEDGRKRLEFAGRSHPLAAMHTRQWAGEAGFFRHRQTILSNRHDSRHVALQNHWFK
jgi:hypothetical protein